MVVDIIAPNFWPTLGMGKTQNDDGNWNPTKDYKSDEERETK